MKLLFGRITSESILSTLLPAKYHNIFEFGEESLIAFIWLQVLQN